MNVKSSAISLSLFKLTDVVLDKENTDESKK